MESVSTSQVPSYSMYIHMYIYFYIHKHGHVSGKISCPFRASFFFFSSPVGVFAARVVDIIRRVSASLFSAFSRDDGI